MLILLVIAANVAKDPLASVLTPLLGRQLTAGVMDFAQANSQGLFILVLVSVYLEVVTRPALEKELAAVNDGLNGLRDQLTDTLTEQLSSTALDTVARTKPREVLELVLKNRYPHRIDNLLNTIWSDGSSADNQIVTFRLSDLPADPPRYRLEMNVTCDIEDPEYLVAFVGTMALADTLRAVRPDLTDIVVLSDRQSLRDAGDKLALPVIQWTEGDHSGSTTQWRTAKILEVPAARFHTYFGELPPSLKSELRLFRADMPSSGVRVALNYVLHQRKDDGYCFYNANRPTYLRRITFDARGLTVDGRRPVFTLRPFLRNYIHATEVGSESAVFEIQVDNWIVRGQGVMLAWH